MKTIYGTVIYLDDCVYGTVVKSPHLYVNKNEMWSLIDRTGKIDFENFDNVKVEIIGTINEGSSIAIDSIEPINSPLRYT